MKRILRALIFSNVFVAAVLTSLTWATYQIVDDLLIHWYVPASVFLGSFVLYTFHRLYKIDYIPDQHLGHRHQFVLRYGRKMKLAMTLAVFVVLLILPNFDADDLVWLVPAAVASIGYTIPFIPAEKKWWRLRDIPMAKPLIISSVVAYLTLSFPLFEQWGIEALLTRHHAALFVERMLFLLAVTIPFELRDRQADEDAGLQTLATSAGFHRAKRIGVYFLSAWVLAGLLLFVFTGVWMWVLVAFPIGALVALMYVKLNPSRGEFFYILCFEGAIVVYALTTAFVSHFQTLASNH